MTIENDIYQYLIADATLLSLLGGTSTNPKIYPLLASADDDCLPPNIVYASPHEGSSNEILDGLRMSFKITTPDMDYDLASRIKERLNSLLDFKQAQRNLGIPSNDFYIMNSEKNGKIDDYDPTTKEVIKVVFYDIVFVKKNP